MRFQTGTTYLLLPHNSAHYTQRSRFYDWSGYVNIHEGLRTSTIVTLIKNGGRIMLLTPTDNDAMLMACPSRGITASRFMVLSNELIATEN